MAFHHGSEGHLAIDDSGGTLRTLSTYVESVDAPLVERDMHDVSTFGATAHTFFPGLKNGTISVSFIWDPTATTGPDVVLSGLQSTTVTSTVEYGPNGNASGDIKYTAECFLKSYKINSSSTDMVKATAEFQLSGAVTRSVVA